MEFGPGKQTILVVDDSSDNIDVLINILSDKYSLKVAKNGEIALKIAMKFVPDIILLDIKMKGMDGYTVCSKLKADVRTKDIPVIFVTSLDDVDDETKGFKLGAVDYITKPIRPIVVLARIETHLQLYDQNRALERKVHERTFALHESRLEIIRRLGLAAEFRDNDTGMHIIRMSGYCSILSKAIGLDDEVVNLVYNATPMHDVGKIGIPDSILFKPGKLTPAERKIMEKHSEFGAKILGEHSDPLLRMARDVALSHHEKWDGSGYPMGLKGEEIPLVGRIVAVADVFDALTSKRPYKEAWTESEAVAYIREQAGKHFDPALVSAFLDNLDKIRTMKRQCAEQK